MSENKNAKTPADGPVAWRCQCGKAYTVTCISSKPAKRQWVGLTDDEMKALFLNEDGVRFARYIEAKLREKNKWLIS